MVAKFDDLRATVKTSQRMKLGGKRNTQIRQAMQGGVVLLAFGNFEAFVRELIEDVFSALSKNAVDSANLDSVTRVHASLICKMGDWSQVKNPSKLSASIWDYRASGGFMVLEDGAPVSGELAEKILDGITYPKLDNIKKLLARLGITEPMQSLKSTARAPVDQYLTSFHDARVDLAHNGTPPGWAEADFLLKLDELTKFAGALDRVIHRWFRGVTGIERWPVS